MLDDFQKAHMTVVRVTESSWGNLETAPGQFNFGWLKDFLDDAHRRGIQVMLGTSSYIIPQWLYEQNPDILMQLEPGIPVHPHSRHSMCLNHPAYRAAVTRYVSALGRAFKDHPAVIGWQLDNEIEHKVNRVCYNPVCRRAWAAWLLKTYGTAQEFNRRLLLESWGMKVTSLDKVPLPGRQVDGNLPALHLANLRFRRDTILEFFAEQTRALRDAGVKHWITTDWNTYFTAIADDPQARRSLDVAGLNFYQPSADRPEFWETLGWHLDMHRSAHGLNKLMTTETRVGVAGSTLQNDPFPTQPQFKMWMLQPVAYGSFGLMFWSGNRWRGGHWPHWGGILDWTGEPEPDFAWLVDVGAFFRKWSETLLNQPVKASAVVITDFDQRSALDIYKHTTSSPRVIPETFNAFHRLGIGVDSMNVPDALTPGKLDRYKLVVLAAATALDQPALPGVLKAYVARGGHVVVSPFTAYMSLDGVFRGDGFGANLAELTGALARTARRMGTAADAGREDQKVAWLDGVSPVGIDGYCEYLNVQPGTEIFGRFQSSEPVLNGQPAAVRRRTGSGSAIKLAFWPRDDSLALLFRSLVPDDQALLAAPAPRGVQAVPRTDSSLFVVNTGSQEAPIRLARAATDRISGRRVQGEVRLKGYEVLWLE
jgi:beta-galactosidase